MCKTINECRRLVQVLLVTKEADDAKITVLTKGILEATNDKAELQKDRGRWKNLYLSETEASNKLASANLEQKQIINSLQAQVKDDEVVIKGQKKKIGWLKVERFIYAGVGAGIGYGIGQSGIRFNF